MNYEFITSKIIEAAKEAGVFIKKERTTFDISKIESKGINDFVSYVDKGAEHIIVEKLLGLIPDAGFITEEQTINKVGADYNWIVDPLDGTTNFIHGLPCFAVSIALKHKEEVVAGVIYEINLDECFYAWQGSKAFLNGNEITVSDRPKLKDSLLVTGFPYNDYNKTDEYLNLFKYFMQHTHGLRRLGSAATDMAYVACGRFEAFYEYGLKPWDVAAGVIIVKQAGGVCVEFSGGDNYIFGNDLICSNAKISAEINSVIKKFMC